MPAITRRTILSGLEDAAHAAFSRHGYTLAAIGGAVSLDPSTVGYWIQRAAARLSRERPLSPEEASTAGNKI